jgi:hypothetical protein
LKRFAAVKLLVTQIPAQEQSAMRTGNLAPPPAGFVSGAHGLSHDHLSLFNGESVPHGTLKIPIKIYSIPPAKVIAAAIVNHGLLSKAKRAASEIKSRTPRKTGRIGIASAKNIQNIKALRSAAL